MMLTKQDITIFTQKMINYYNRNKADIQLDVVQILLDFNKHPQQKVLVYKRLSNGKLFGPASYSEDDIRMMVENKQWD